MQFVDPAALADVVEHGLFGRGVRRTRDGASMTLYLARIDERDARVTWRKCSSSSFDSARADATPRTLLP